MSRGHAVGRDPAQVRGLGEHPVVAHLLNRRLAGVLERDFDFGAVGGDGDFLLVERHLVGAGDVDLADLVGGERAAGAAKHQGQAGDAYECAFMV